MATFGDRLAILITADGKGAIREIKNVGDAADKDIGKATNRLDKFSDSALRTGAVMVGASVAIGYALASTVKSAQEAELAQLKLQNSVNGSARVSSSSVAAFNAQATALQKITVASDEAITGVQAILVQFGLSEKQVLTLTPLIVDLSRKMGVDFDAAAKAVGKSLDGNAGALKRMGINVDETRFATDRFGAVLEALAKTEGFAVAEGKTFDGQMGILANRMDELKESIGAGVVGALNAVLPILNSVAGTIGDVDAVTGGAIGKFGTFAVAGLALAGIALIIAGGVVKAIVAMQTLAIVAPRTAVAVSMVGTALPWLALAAAVYALSSAIGDALVKSANEARQAVVDMGGRGQESVDEFYDAVTEGAKESLSTVERLRRAALEGIHFTITGTEVLKATREEFAKLAAESPAAATALLSTIEKLGTASGLSAEQVSVMREELAKSALDSAKLGQAQEIASIAIQKAAASLDSEEVALRKTVTARWALIDAERAATGAGLDLASAELAKTAAEKAFAESATPENYIALGRANLGVEASVKAVAVAAEDAAIKALPAFSTASDVAAASTYSQRAALEALKVTAPQLIPIIDKYLLALKPTGDTYTGTVDLNTAPAEEALRRYTDRLTISTANWGAIVRAYWAMNPGSAPPARAHGGPVSRLRPYIVGERGPEIFVPASSGHIIPNKSVSASGGGSAAGGGSTLTINVSVASGGDPAEVGRKTVDAIRAYERRSGTLWRN